MQNVYIFVFIHQTSFPVAALSPVQLRRGKQEGPGLLRTLCIEPSLAPSPTEQKLSLNTCSQNSCIFLFYTKYKAYT